MISQIPKANTYSLSVSIWPCSYSTDMCGWLLLFDGANLNMWLLLVPSDCCLCLSQHDFILTGRLFLFSFTADSEHSSSDKNKNL